MSTKILTESIDLSEGTLDSENRVIRGVVLIRAGMSKNRRFYSEEVLQKAAPAFEASKAYINHPSKSEIKDRPERDVRDISGWYANVRYQEGKLIADRYFTRNQAGQDAFSIAEDIVSHRAPATLAGLSINAVGQGKMDKFEDGEALRVESISAANSVDDVSQAAAGGGYRLTAGTGDELQAAFIESLDYPEWVGIKPDYVERLHKEWKQIRLDEATKAALSESDLRVKAAVAEAGTLREALDVAQVKIDALVSERDAALVEVQSKARELALEKALRQAKLPIVVENDLRARLMASALEQWSAIIQGEREKLRALGIKPHIAVSGAGQQIAPAHVTQVKADPIVEARRQIAAAQTPAELQRIIESIRS